MDLAVLEQGMALLILSFLYLAAGKPFMPARREPGLHKHCMKSVPGWRIFKRSLFFTSYISKERIFAYSR